MASSVTFFGRRPLFMVAIAIFVVGSLASGLATTMYELAAYRALQGMGAGGLFALALTIIADIVPPRDRARYQGFFFGRIWHIQCDWSRCRWLLRRYRPVPGL